MKYVHYYETTSAFTADYEGDAYLEPWVSYTADEERVDYNAHREDWSTVPLTIEIVSVGSPQFELAVGSVKNSSNANVKPSYSINGGEWTNEYVAGSLITGLSVGDEIQFKATGVQAVSPSSWPFFYLNSSVQFRYNIKGNIASLFYGDDFENADGTGLASGCCSGIFRGNAGSCPVDASKLVLPFTTLRANDYNAMFSLASDLVLPPAELPATVLPANVYTNMFNGCTSLIKTPDMGPETFVGTGACMYMFSGCTSLETAFETLPATAITGNCYNSMFMGCSSLVKAPAILAQSLVNAYSSLYGMFSGCTSLNYVKAMFTDLGTVPFSAYGYGWLLDVSATGTFVKNVNAVWTESDVIPAGWTVQTATQ